MVAFDVETTGLSHETEEIIEVGAVKFTFERQADLLRPVELGSYASLVKPSKPIPPGASQINHIFDDMVKDAPCIAQVIPHFAAFCGINSILVAHNASFDTSFLGRAISRSRLPFPRNPIFDTLKLFRKISHEYSSHKLGRIAEQMKTQIQLQADPRNLHRADYDCRVLAHILCAALRKRYQDSDLHMANAFKSLKAIHGKPLLFEEFAV